MSRPDLHSPIDSGCQARSNPAVWPLHADHTPQAFTLCSFQHLTSEAQAQVLSYNDRLPGMDVCVKHMRTDNLPDCVFPQGRPTGPSAAPSGSLQPPSDPLPAPANTPDAPLAAPPAKRPAGSYVSLQASLSERLALRCPSHCRGSPALAGGRVRGSISML